MRKGTKVGELLPGVQLSHEEPVWQSLQFLIHGRYGCGKTFLALTVSEKFKGWPEKREKEITVLDDLFIIGFDKKPVAGLKERGYSVPQVNIHKLRTDEETWKAAGFTKEPTIFQATEYALNAAKAYGPRWLILDTVTAMARQVELYHAKKLTKEHEQSRKWGRIKDAHIDLYNVASQCAPGLITIFHSKAPPMDVTKDGKSKEDRAREDALVSASGGVFRPAMSGQGISMYKGDDSLCLGVSAVVKGSGPGRHYVRKVEVLSDKYETKNRWELSLPNEVPNDLGKVINMLEGEEA